MKIRKGDRLVYTGAYAPGVTKRYPPGTVVGFRNYRTLVTVLLDGDEGYADWPVGKVAPAPAREQVDGG